MNVPGSIEDMILFTCMNVPGSIKLHEDMILFTRMNVNSWKYNYIKLLLGNGNVCIILADLFLWSVHDVLCMHAYQSH